MTNDNWLEWQATEGKKIQKRMSQILRERGKADNYELSDVQAASEQAMKELGYKS